MTRTSQTARLMRRERVKPDVVDPTPTRNGASDVEARGPLSVSACLGEGQASEARESGLYVEPQRRRAVVTVGSGVQTARADCSALSFGATGSSGERRLPYVDLGWFCPVIDERMGRAATAARTGTGVAA